MFASTPSERSINETSVDAGEEGEDDSTVTEVTLKAPLSTVNNEDVSVEADRIEKSIDENSTIPVVGLIVNTGVFVPIDLTDFFVLVSPEMVTG